jgi:hypothetical protein
MDRTKLLFFPACVVVSSLASAQNNFCDGIRKGYQ